MYFMFQMVRGDLLKISQPTVSRLVKLVSTLFARHLPSHIKFPDQLAKIKRDFYDMTEFPGVIGCIDCTHVPISSPGGAVGLNYKNRTGWYSVNVQVRAYSINK